MVGLLASLFPCPYLGDLERVTNQESQKAYYLKDVETPWGIQFDDGGPRGRGRDCGGEGTQSQAQKNVSLTAPSNHQHSLGLRKLSLWLVPSALGPPGCQGDPASAWTREGRLLAPERFLGV
jgi:hypothetical protein